VVRGVFPNKGAGRGKTGIRRMPENLGICPTLPYIPIREEDEGESRRKMEKYTRHI